MILDDDYWLCKSGICKWDTFAQNMHRYTFYSSMNTFEQTLYNHHTCIPYCTEFVQKSFMQIRNMRWIWIRYKDINVRITMLLVSRIILSYHTWKSNYRFESYMEYKILVILHGYHGNHAVVTFSHQNFERCPPRRCSWRGPEHNGIQHLLTADRL